MSLSSLAERILEAHSREPNSLFYAVELLGSFFREGDVRLLDESYGDLRNAGLMEESPEVITFFGAPKRLMKITPAGLQHASRGHAA